MSDLGESAHLLSERYATRMTIEEFFRDGKNRRNVYALQNTQIKHSDCFDRFLLILVLAYIECSRSCRRTQGGSPMAPDAEL